MRLRRATRQDDPRHPSRRARDRAALARRLVAALREAEAAAARPAAWAAARKAGHCRRARGQLGVGALCALGLAVGWAQLGDYRLLVGGLAALFGWLGLWERASCRLADREAERRARPARDKAARLQAALAALKGKTGRRAASPAG